MISFAHEQSGVRHRPHHRRMTVVLALLFHTPGGQSVMRAVHGG